MSQQSRDDPNRVEDDRFELDHRVSGLPHDAIVITCTGRPEEAH